MHDIVMIFALLTLLYSVEMLVYLWGVFWLRLYDALIPA